MECAALPTYVASAPKKQRASNPVSEQQLQFYREMNIDVSSDQYPRGVSHGDLFWDEKLVHPDVMVLRGVAYNVAWVLMIKKSIAGRVASWPSIIDAALLPVHEQLSKWNCDSALSKLNKEGSLSIVPPLLKAALELCSLLHSESGGCFDASVAPLIEAWNESLERKNAALTPTQIQASREFEKKCYFHVQLSPQELLSVVGGDKVLSRDFQLAKGAKLDLDSVSKVKKKKTQKRCKCLFLNKPKKTKKNKKRDLVSIWLCLF
jgi:hypothetical protein